MKLWIKIGGIIALLTVFAVAGVLVVGSPPLALALTILGAVAIGFTRWSLAPLEDVTQVIEGIASGDLQHDTIDDRSSDEIGRLAKSTNSMIAQLAELSNTAEHLAAGDIGIAEVEKKVLESGRLSDVDLPEDKAQGDLERSFIRLTNQMRRLTIQARVIASDDLNSPLLEEPVPGELGDAFGLMVRNLQTIADRAKDIAEGDLTSYVKGDGDLTMAFNQMVTGLNDLIQRIVHTALHISSASEEILVVLQDQELAASHQASGVEETQRTMETLLASARKISDNSQTVFKSAEKTQSNNRTVAERIGELKSHTARISEILEVIKSIADRSDLLALNASLEGMRAGEAGKGFTLVAAEMRRLAENIKESIGDIKELVSDIRESSLAAVMATEEGSRLSERTTDTALQISLITQQQQSGTEQVTQSMEELSHLINQGVAGTRQVTTAADELASASESLRQLVDEFEVVNQAPPATSHHRPEVADINTRPTRPTRQVKKARTFAQQARSAYKTPVQFDERPARAVVPKNHDAVDTAEVHAQPDDQDELDAPTVEFSSAMASDDGLFDDLPSMSSDDGPDRSGEFETIARQIESTEIDTKAMEAKEENGEDEAKADANEEETESDSK